jgi:hypothetical protein
MEVRVSLNEIKFGCPIDLACLIEQAGSLSTRELVRLVEER